MMNTMNSPLLIAAVAAATVSLLPRLVGRIFRMEYSVPVKGAVLVSGASSGIGHDAALALAKDGYVVYAGVLNSKEADTLHHEAKECSLEDHLRPITLDITKQEDVDAAVSVIKSGVKPLVAVVNNAGISILSPVETANLEVVRAQFEVNVFGTWRVTQAFLPLLRAGKGRIVIMGSLAGLASTPTFAAYSGTKHALEAFADSLRMECLGQGLSVSLIQPGQVRTPFQSNEAELATKLKAELKDHDQGELYGSLLQKSIDMREEFLASKDGLIDKSTDATTSAIRHAIQDRYPKTRYPVTGVPGLPASVIVWISALLPDRLIDFISMNL